MPTAKVGGPVWRKTKTGLRALYGRGKMRAEKFPMPGNGKRGGNAL